MRTEFVTPEKYVNALLQIAKEYEPDRTERPERFKTIMKQNRGVLSSAFLPYGPTEDGLERRNPVIVVLGDSVTAGHFEFIVDLAEFVKRIEEGKIGEFDAVEITDARQCYPTKLRDMLIDEYEQTSVNVLNCGIAGDDVAGMSARLNRDVISHQPDLVIVNAALNWPEEKGDTDTYEETLRDIVRRVKEGTDAEIILLTPNKENAAAIYFTNPLSSLDDRVVAIRRIAKEEDVFLVDVYRIWEEYVKQGYPLEELLANGMNHPSVTGHEVYAIALMKLLKKN